MTYSIIVSKGAFKSVEEAAYGEKAISWADSSSDECRACTECFAAVDMRNILENKKGLDVKVYDIGDFPEKGVLIFAGEESSKLAAKKYDLPYETVDGEEKYRLYGTKKENISIVLVYGGSRRATAYGIIEYMNYHGIRFTSPEEYGTSYVESLDLSMNENFDIVEEPSYKSREAYSEFMKDTSIDFLMWAYHNKLNYFFIKEIENPHLPHKLCLNMIGGGHEIWFKHMDINQEYPYKHKIFGGEGKPEDPYKVSPFYKGDTNGDGILTYGDAHPEWFAEVDGVHTLKRDYDLFERISYATGDFICTTNEEGTDEFIKLILETLISGESKDASNFKLFGLDNGTWCQCEKCREHKSLSYRLLMLAYKLNKAILKATEEGKIKRKITIEIPAYHETLPPPDKALPDDFDYSRIFVTFYVIERCYVHNIDDKKCVETNKDLCDKLIAWTSGYYKGEIMVGEYYNVSSFAAMPFVFAERIKNDIPFYHSIGTRHLVYMHMLGRCWGVQALNNHLFAKLMWNVNADAQKLIDEYFVARYGKHAEKMKAVYKEIEEAGANCKYIKHYQALEGKTRAHFRFLNDEDPSFFPLKHSKLDYREDDYQAGPSLKEMRERYEACLCDFTEYIKEEESASLEEDYEQLKYGVDTLNYTYYKTLSKLNEDDKEALSKTEFYKEKLLGISSPLRGYDFGDRFKNGFSALAMHEQKSKK